MSGKALSALHILLHLVSSGPRRSSGDFTRVLGEETKARRNEVTNYLRSHSKGVPEPGFKPRPLPPLCSQAPHTPGPLEPLAEIQRHPQGWDGSFLPGHRTTGSRPGASTLLMVMKLGFP